MQSLGLGSFFPFCKAHTELLWLWIPLTAVSNDSCLEESPSPTASDTSVDTGSPSEHKGLYTSQQWRILSLKSPVCSWSMAIMSMCFEGRKISLGFRPLLEASGAHISSGGWCQLPISSCGSYGENLGSAFAVQSEALLWTHRKHSFYTRSQLGLPPVRDKTHLPGLDGWMVSCSVS